MSPAKTELRDALVAALQHELDALEAAHRAVMEAATHEEAKPENDKDTRALEQSYLARGQALRVEAMRVAVAETRAMPLRDFTARDPVALGARVSLDDEGTSRTVFLAPHGGGTSLEGGVQTVTPASPLGRALLGRRVGDVIETVTAGRTREVEITGLD